MKFLFLDPYILNQNLVRVSFVRTVTTPAPTHTIANDANLAVSFGPVANSEICLISTWTIQFTLASDIVPGDHIIVKFTTPERFTFLRTGATSPIGNVVIIDHTLLGTPLSVSPTSIQYFIEVTTTLTAGAPASFTIAGIRNANDPTPGVVLEMIYW